MAQWDVDAIWGSFSPVGTLPPCRWRCCEQVASASCGARVSVPFDSSLPASSVPSSVSSPGFTPQLPAFLPPTVSPSKLSSPLSTVILANGSHICISASPHPAGFHVIVFASSETQYVFVRLYVFRVDFLLLNCCSTFLREIWCNF